MSDGGNATLSDVLRFVSRTGLIALDERFEDSVNDGLGESHGSGASPLPESEREGDDKEDLEAAALGRGLAWAPRLCRTVTGGFCEAL